MTFPISSPARAADAPRRADAALLLPGVAAVALAAAPWPMAARAIGVALVLLAVAVLRGDRRARPAIDRDPRGSRERAHEANGRGDSRRTDAARSAAACDARERFLVNVVHELRTPLALVHGPLQQLLRAPALDPSARRLAEVAHGNALRLLNVADDLLALGRGDDVPDDGAGAPGDTTGGAAVPEPVVPWRLDDWLRDLLASIAHHPGLGRLPLEEHLAAEDASLAVAPARLERVLLNLVANAIKFADGRGAIRIGSFADAAHAGFWIEDDGIGIDPVHHERIFARFAQVDAGATRRFGGVGIGLALARRTVRAMGGDIAVRSNLGEGARFTVTLPRAAAAGRFLPRMDPLHGSAADDPSGREHGAQAVFEQVLRRPLLIDAAPPGVAGDASSEGLRRGGGAAVAPPAEPCSDVPDHAVPDGRPCDPTPLEPAGPWPSAAGAPGSPSRLSVVIIEDEPQMRWLLVEALREEFDVHAAGDGDAGLALARTALPDVVLTDWMMPGRDGLQVARALRAAPPTAELRIAMITARIGEAERVAALAAGIDDFVGKPFSMAELRARLRNLGRHARAERDLRARHAALSAAHRALADTRALLIQDEKLKSIGVLAAGLIHEINNPVSYMRTACELLGRDEVVSARPAARELVEALADGLARVGALVADLRVFAYPGGPPADGRPAAQRIDFDDIVQRALRLTSAPLRGVTVQVDPAPADLAAAGAPAALLQVVVNLLDNAARALKSPDRTGAPAPVVRIGVTREGDLAVLAVQDNGPGVAPEVQARLFEPFFTTREVGQGLGLGLAVSQAIARAHGGRLTAETPPEGGARFVLRLPAAA